jgi:putative endonuclease
LDLYSIYLLECSDKSLYCGITNNLEIRLKHHNQGTASKYTKARLPVVLKCAISGFTHSQALKIEYQIKHTRREDKIRLLLKHRLV